MKKNGPIHTHTHTHHSSIVAHSSMVACLWVLAHSGPTIEVHLIENPRARKMGAGSAFKEVYHNETNSTSNVPEPCL
jgi:hypothetical protein